MISPLAPQAVTVSRWTGLVTITAAARRINARWSGSSQVHFGSSKTPPWQSITKRAPVTAQ